MNNRHKSIRHKSLRLQPHEHEMLKEMYLERQIPIDQYEGRSTDLAALVEEWNTKTGRTDSGGDLIHYMRTKRKRGKWPTLDGAHQQKPAIRQFSAEDVETLVAIYREDIAAMGIGSDVIAYEPELRDLLVKEFATRTSEFVAADDLVAKLTELRKAGILPTAADIPKRKQDGIGFEDIEAV